MDDLSYCASIIVIVHSYGLENLISHTLPLTLTSFYMQLV
jgi:hypothetical protein